MQQFANIMHNSQTLQCDPPRMAKPTRAYDIDRAGFGGRELRDTIK
jgi:hypothetical protein